MRAKIKTITAVGLVFVGVITYLGINIAKNFNYLDLAYMLFIIGCFIRYIYLKIETHV